MIIVEANGMNARCISDQLFMWYNMNRQINDSRDDFYCGIAQNPEERISDHEREDHDGREITIAVAYKCDSMEIAAEVESIMHNLYQIDFP